MRNRATHQFFLGMAIIVLLSIACSTDREPTAEPVMRPLPISNVTYSSWNNNVTRSATYPDAREKKIWVSANDATPSRYAYSTASSKFEVETETGSPQEWNGVSADVYGFFTSTEANRVNTPFSVAVEQNGTQSYDFQASGKHTFSYSVQNSDGVNLHLYQQLTHIKVTVEDANENTQVLMGNSLLYCSGMFQYTDPGEVAKFHTSEGYWVFTGNRQTMTLTDSNSDKVFECYILPQTIATATHFFRVYNTSTGRSAYYALPNDNYSLEEGHEYTCTLLQNVKVASIQVDEDFSNNSGDTKEIETEASN